MRRVLLSLVLCSMSVSAVADALSDLSERLNRFTTMSAAFHQALYAGKKQPAQTSRGTMALRRPGQFIWETTYPNQQKLVANGQVAWVYDVDLEQATRQMIDDHNVNSPAVFLTGDVSTLPQRYDVSQKGEVFTLRAKKKDDMFQSFELHFSGDKLTRMDVHTRLDQTSRFDFTQIKLNPTFAQNYFVFTPPKGVDVLEN